MKQEDFVTYDLALAIKELGFNEKTIATYVKSEFLGYPTPTFSLAKQFNIDAGNTKNDNTFISMPGCASAPTYTEAFKWLKEKYDLGSAFILHDYKALKMREGMNYQEAQEACLIELIDIVKENK